MGELVLRGPQRHDRERDQERSIVRGARAGPAPQHQEAATDRAGGHAEVEEHPPSRAPDDTQRGQVQAQEDLRTHVCRPEFWALVAPVEQRPEPAASPRAAHLRRAHAQLHLLQVCLQLGQHIRGHRGLEPGQANDSREAGPAAPAQEDEPGRHADRVREHRRDALRGERRPRALGQRRGARGLPVGLAAVVAGEGAEVQVRVRAHQRAHARPAAGRALARPPARGGGLARPPGVLLRPDVAEVVAKVAGRREGLARAAPHGDAAPGVVRDVLDPCHGRCEVPAGAPQPPPEGAPTRGAGGSERPHRHSAKLVARRVGEEVSCAARQRHLHNRTLLLPSPHLGDGPAGERQEQGRARGADDGVGNVGRAWHARDPRLEQPLARLQAERQGEQPDQPQLPAARAEPVRQVVRGAGAVLADMQHDGQGPQRHGGGQQPDGRPDQAQPTQRLRERAQPLGRILGRAEGGQELQARQGAAERRQRGQAGRGEAQGPQDENNKVQTDSHLRRQRDAQAQGPIPRRRGALGVPRQRRVPHQQHGLVPGGALPPGQARGGDAKVPRVRRARLRGRARGPADPGLVDGARDLDVWTLPAQARRDLVDREARALPARLLPAGAVAGRHQEHLRAGLRGAAGEAG
mmetsp:Transcript_222/g.620  ORF Transcript_222/g.620 Transcript_222/m.620 type:complete len:635 (+) Transcript_222:1194-3098(+)